MEAVGLMEPFPSMALQRPRPDRVLESESAHLLEMDLLFPMTTFLRCFDQGVSPEEALSSPGWRPQESHPLRL